MFQRPNIWYIHEKLADLSCSIWFSCITCIFIFVFLNGSSCVTLQPQRSGLTCFLAASVFWASQYQSVCFLGLAKSVSSSPFTPKLSIETGCFEFSWAGRSCSFDVWCAGFSSKRGNLHVRSGWSNAVNQHPPTCPQTLYLTQISPCPMLSRHHWPHDGHPLTLQPRPARSPPIGKAARGGADQWETHAMVGRGPGDGDRGVSLVLPRLSSDQRACEASAHPDLCHHHSKLAWKGWKGFYPQKWKGIFRRCPINQNCPLWNSYSFDQREKVYNHHLGVLHTHTCNFFYNLRR